MLIDENGTQSTVEGDPNVAARFDFRVAEPIGAVNQVEIECEKRDKSAASYQIASTGTNIESSSSEYSTTDFICGMNFQQETD